MSVCLTVGGADEGKAGDDPEEGHDVDDDAPKDRAAVLSLEASSSQPIRAQPGWLSSAAAAYHT